VAAILGGLLFCSFIHKVVVGEKHNGEKGNLSHKKASEFGSKCATVTRLEK